MPEGAIYQAKVSFKAGGRIVRQGETIREGHPLLVAYPDKFKPLEVVHEVAERATATPGEKRGGPVKQTTKKKGE